MDEPPSSVHLLSVPTCTGVNGRLWFRHPPAHIIIAPAHRYHLLYSEGRDWRGKCWATCRCRPVLDYWSETKDPWHKNYSPQAHSVPSVFNASEWLPLCADGCPVVIGTGLQWHQWWHAISWPPLHSVPSDLNRTIATATAKLTRLLAVPICMGLVLLIVVPSPNWPLVLAPRPWERPLLFQSLRPSRMLPAGSWPGKGTDFLEWNGLFGHEHSQQTNRQ